MKSTLDTHLRVVDVVLICEWRRVVLWLHFLNFGSHSTPEFERSGIMGWKVKFSVSQYEIKFGHPFEGCRCGLDCEWKHLVLGLHFLNFRSHSRPEFEQSGIMGWKVKLFASKYEINFGYPFESCRLGLDLRAETCSYWAIFSQLRVTFQAWVWTKWDYGLKSKILRFQIWNQLWIPIWELEM